jgi:hypothetical protein
MVENCLNDQKIKKRKPKGEFDLSKIDNLLLEKIIYGVKIYFGNVKADVSQEKAYLLFLKQISSSHGWKFKRINLKSVIPRNDESELILKHFDEWINTKVNQFPASGKMEQINAAASFYQNKIENLGVSMKYLSLKVSQLSSERSTSRNYSNCSNSFDSSYSTASEASSKIFENDLLTNKGETLKNQTECRLCGDKNSTLVINLSQKMKEISFKQSIEFYCR